MSHPSRQVSFRLLQITGAPLSSDPEHFLLFSFHSNGFPLVSSSCELRHQSATAFALAYRFTFSYWERTPGDALAFTLCSRGDGMTPLARAEIPLEWLPPDRQLQDAFQMEPAGVCAAAPTLFLELCDHAVGQAPFDAAVPAGSLAPRRGAGAHPLAPAPGDFSPPQLGRRVSFPDLALEEPPPADDDREFRSLDAGALRPVDGFSFFPRRPQLLEDYHPPPPLRLRLE
jgi:hypothetical protein